MVILKAGDAPDTRKMLGLTRHLRTNLSNTTDAGFPILSFVSARDAAKLDVEAA